MRTLELGGIKWTLILNQILKETGWFGLILYFIQYGG
jgi:hypothetical protein